MSAVDSGQFVHEQVRAGNSRRNLSLPIPESECETGRMNDAQCQDGDELDDRTLHGRYTDARVHGDDLEEDTSHLTSNDNDHRVLLRMVARQQLKREGVSLVVDGKRQ